MRSLIVVRGGDKSLHIHWWTKPEDRTFDIALSYYGDNPDFWRDKCDYFFPFKKSKFEGLSDFIDNNTDLINKYDFVWFVDDDLWMHPKDVERYFEICRSNQFILSQPSLMRGSFFHWRITLQRKFSRFRKVDFVEIMAPCFRVKDFHLFASTFKENTSGMGLEWLWRKIGQENKRDFFAIVDEVSMLHTREVGSAGSAGAKRNPVSEMEELIQKYGLEKTRPRVLKNYWSASYIVAKLLASIRPLQKTLRKIWPNHFVHYQSKRY